jgi:DNA-binding MarR family transcriptional regulator
MGIAKEIHQSSFRSEHHKALVNIIYSSNWLLERVKQVLEKEDITHQQYNILRILKGSARPMSTLQIRERMLDKMSDTSRIVERLLKKGWVHKVVCAKDKRLVDVTITTEGLQLLERLDEKSIEMDNVTKALSAEDAQALNSLLDKMRQATPDAPR